MDLHPDTLAILREVSTATITSQLLKQGRMRTRAMLGVAALDPAAPIVRPPGTTTGPDPDAVQSAGITYFGGSR